MTRIYADLRATLRRRALHLQDRSLIDFERDLVLQNLFDHEFDIRSTFTIHEWSCAIDNLDKAALDERSQLEPTTELVNNFIALECVNHGAGLCPVNGKMVGKKMAGGRWREKAETNPELSVADFRGQP